MNTNEPRDRLMAAFVGLVYLMMVCAWLVILPVIGLLALCGWLKC